MASVIQGATRGAGGRALSRHLLAKAKNERVSPLPARGLAGADLHQQLHELTVGARHGRTARPVLHLHVDPDTDWTADRWQRHLDLYEAEFGLTEQPRLGVEHTKDGRTHRHYAWSLVRPDGSVLDLRHDHARREKISRLLEHEYGAPLTPGAHNRAVAQALRKDGRADVADAMEAAGLLKGKRPRAPLTPPQRAQEERTEIQKSDVVADAVAAWRAADGGTAFPAALSEKGLRLAQGDRVIVVIDASGGAHPLARLLRAATSDDAFPITAADVRARLHRLDLPRYVSGADLPPLPQPIAAPVPESMPTPVTATSSEARTDQPTPWAVSEPVHFPAPADEARNFLSAGQAEFRQKVAHSNPPRSTSRLPSEQPRTTEEDTTMPALATRRPRARPAPARQTKAAAWILAGGGYDALPTPAQNAARRSYEIWSKTKPDLARRHTLPDYVTYVQRQHERDQQPETQQQAPGVAAADRDQAGLRRARVLTGLLRQHYGTDWLPDTVADRLSRVELNQNKRCAVLHLTDGGRLIDYGDRIEVSGMVTADAVAELAAAAERHGWTSVHVTGSSDFRDAAAVAMSLRQPPIKTDHEITPAAQARLSDAIARRALAQVPPIDLAALSRLAPSDAAAARVAAERRRCMAVLTGKPAGETDPATIARPQIAELAARRDAAGIEAAEARDLATQHRQAHRLLSRILPGPTSRRQRALDREADRLTTQFERMTRSYKGDVRAVARQAKASAKATAAAIENWEWTKPTKSALNRQAALDRVAEAVANGDQVVITAAACGDMLTAITAADAAIIRRRLATQQIAKTAGPTTPEGKAMRNLMTAEDRAAAPAALAVIRTTTAAAMAGDPSTVAAAAAGDLEAARLAAAEWRERRRQAEQQRQQQAARTPVAEPDQVAPGYR